MQRLILTEQIEQLRTGINIARVQVILINGKKTQNKDNVKVVTT